MLSLYAAKFAGDSYVRIYTEKYFLNLVKSNQNKIVLTIFRLIWNQNQFRLVQNQSENGKSNPI